MLAVSDFAKKSGDYHNLSATDLKLLALTYELEVKENGESHLRTEPLQKITNTTVTVPVNTKNDDQDRNMEAIEEMDERETREDNEDTKEPSANGDTNEDDDGWTVIKRPRQPKKFDKVEEAEQNETSVSESLESSKLTVSFFTHESLIIFHFILFP